MLILVWTVLCDLFQSHLLIIVIVNTSFFVVFTSLAFIIATLPNIFTCRKQEIDENHQPLMLEHQSKSSKLVDCWRFFRERTITIIFCRFIIIILNSLSCWTIYFISYRSYLISTLVSI
jgi:hypothetical protein